jgi:hypothetical protein
VGCEVEILFNLQKLNNVAVKKKYEPKISNRFANLENLDYDDMNISMAWKSIKNYM